MDAGDLLLAPVRVHFPSVSERHVRCEHEVTEVFAHEMARFFLHDEFIYVKISPSIFASGIFVQRIIFTDSSQAFSEHLGDFCTY